MRNKKSGYNPQSVLSLAGKLSCRRTALKRCTNIEILWYRKLVSLASPEFRELLLSRSLRSLLLLLYCKTWEVQVPTFCRWSVHVQRVHHTAAPARSVTLHDRPCVRRVCGDTRFDSVMDNAMVRVLYISYYPLVKTLWSSNDSFKHNAIWQTDKGTDGNRVLLH